MNIETSNNEINDENLIPGSGYTGLDENAASSLDQQFLSELKTLLSLSGDTDKYRVTKRFKKNQNNELTVHSDDCMFNDFLERSRWQFLIMAEEISAMKAADYFEAHENEPRFVEAYRLLVARLRQATKGEDLHAIYMAYANHLSQMDFLDYKRSDVTLRRIAKNDRKIEKAREAGVVARNFRDEPFKGKFARDKDTLTSIIPMEAPPKKKKDDLDRLLDEIEAVQIASVVH